MFNDVSARSLKIAEGRNERNGDWFFDWLLGKWCDSFAVVGPYLVTRDEAGDPNGLEMALKVNGGAASAFVGRRDDFHYPRNGGIPLPLRHATAG